MIRTCIALLAVACLGFSVSAHSTPTEYCNRFISITSPTNNATVTRTNGQFVLDLNYSDMDGDTVLVTVLNGNNQPVGGGFIVVSGTGTCHITVACQAGNNLEIRSVVQGDPTCFSSVTGLTVQ